MGMLRDHRKLLACSVDSENRLILSDLQEPLGFERQGPGCPAPVGNALGRLAQGDRLSRDDVDGCCSMPQAYLNVLDAFQAP